MTATERSIKKQKIPEGHVMAKFSAGSKLALHFLCDTAEMGKFL
jgi:hypothetical protein